MIKRMIIMLLLVGIVLGSVYAFKQFQGRMIKQYMAKIGKAPQTVATVVAGYDVWNTKIDAVGTFTAINGVDVSTEVSGIIQELNCPAGEYVATGTLLAKLRVDDDLALLASLKAIAHLDSLTYERDLQQLKQKAIAQSTVDLDAANLEKSLALINQQQAIIDKKIIRAPFAGRLGISPVNIGQYVGPGTVIVPLQVLDPIRIDFYLPQQDLANVKIGQPVAVHTNLHPGKLFDGKMIAINAKVDQSSRNILVRAELANPEKELLPGMYGMVAINTGNNKRYITLPLTAITYNPYGNTVFVAKPSGTDPAGNAIYTAELKFVTVGPTRGDQVAVLDGIDAGEIVVVAGQIKLQKGSTMIINNDVMPTNDINPQPIE